MASRWRAGVGVLLVVAALFAGTGRASADDGAWKAANDTDPHVPLTPYQQEKSVQKQRAVAAHFSSASGTVVTARADASPGAAVLTAGPAALAGLPASGSLLANQTPQQRSYWCGPAAVQEGLGQMGVAISQSTAATRLGTTTDGTAWSGGSTSTGHPVADVLNAYQSRNYYLPWSVPSAPSTGDVTNYESYLVNDIVFPVAPVIGDAWETQSSKYHLIGHPHDRPIFHWFDIRGYTGTGVNTMYEDSVHNAASVAWSASVPAYSTLPSSQIVTIVGGRGYVW